MPTLYMPLRLVGYVQRQLSLHLYDQVLSALCFLGISYVFLMFYYCYTFQRNLHFTYKVALILTHTQECFILFIPSCKGSRVNSCSYTVLLLHFIWYCKICFGTEVGY